MVEKNHLLKMTAPTAKREIRRPRVEPTRV
jgi:hypothetical protein